MPAVQICPRCKRANPELAVYCYQDGYELRAPTAGASFRMPSEFVFPSSRRCRTYDEFAQACQEEWSAARDLLQRGTFGQFFNSCGRADLVRAAQDANATGNPDAALATFLAALPGVRTQTPRLDINPRRLLLGNLLAGETRKLPVTITNAGQGSLQGTASITEGQDLISLAADRAVHELSVDAPRQQGLTLYLNTRGLPANQGHGGKLTVVTNGGVAELPLRLDLVARPFSVAPFQGVKAQRELAERMKQQPKAAVPLLESGEVRRWFETNGWTYPVAGPEVRGVAAVQQFFEAMGLSKPPVVHVSPAEVRLRCKYPDTARFELSLSTPAKKWVYATIASDSPWVKVLAPQVSGPQKTAFLIEVDSSRMTAVGAHGEAKLKVIANGGKTIEVRVIADVAGMPNVRAGAASSAPAASTRPGAAPAAPPLKPAGESASWFRSSPATPAVPTAALAPTGDNRASAPANIPTAAHAPPAAKIKSTADATARSSFVASLLILPLLFVLLRLAMVPIADGYLRSAGIHSAARQLDIKITDDSPVGRWAGWLRLPWLSIMGGDNATISNELFDPDNHGSLPAGELRDYFVGSFVRTLAISTWWLGGLLGALLLWRRGGPLDVPWGFIAGSVGGLAAAATFASVFLVIEMFPQFIWHVIARDSGGPAAWTGWIVVATVSWLALGAGAGTVCAVLPPLRRVVLLPLQRIPAAALNMLGMPKAAAFWWNPAV
jgi:hypothetical protein